MASPRKHYLFVGHWLRDFDALFAFIDLSTEQDREVIFDLVVPDMSHRTPQVEERMKQIESLSCVIRHKGIDDEALRELYRKATLLLMPLKDSTANNAVLEAMSCGLPIVTTVTSGIHDYADEFFARICPAGDVVSMHNATRQIAASRERQAEMSSASRKQALKEFDWQIICESVASIYRSLG